MARAVRGAAAIAACLIGLAACGGPPPAPRTVNVDESDETYYVIGPGDSLSIQVYRTPELSTGVTVRPDGRITIPLIEDLLVAGKTSTQAAREIEEKLKQYVKDPAVTVIVQSFNGPFDRQIKVIGEATNPKALNYRQHMTILDVMIETGGVTKFAAGNSAVIVRHYGTPEQETFNVRLTDLIKNGDISKNVEMLPGDTLIIPQSWF
jgi:polysaccharide export outer membrane protein